MSDVAANKRHCYVTSIKRSVERDWHDGLA